MSIEVLRRADWLTLERVRRLATIFAIASLIAVAIDFWAHGRNGLIDAAGEHLGRDFVNYWAAGRAALQGEGARVYDVNWFLAFQRSLVGAHAEFKFFGYPPVATILVAPLGALPYALGLAVWLGGAAVAGAWLLSRSIGWRLGLLASFGAPAVMVNAMAGQNGALTAALMGAALMALPRRPLLAGVLFGALCYKPQLGLLIPVALAAGGYWRTAAAAAAMVLALVAASVAAFGIEAWTGFLHTLPLQRLLMETGDTFWRRMPTAFAAMRLLGAPPAAAYAVQALSSLLAAGAVVMVWRGRAPAAVKGAALIVAASLSSPYAWDYDLVSLTFGVAWMAVEGARTGFRPWEKLALAFSLVAPIVMSPIGKYTGVPFGLIALWALLALIVRRAGAPEITGRLAPASEAPTA